MQGYAPLFGVGAQGAGKRSAARPAVGQPSLPAGISRAVAAQNEQLQICRRPWFLSFQHLKNKKASDLCALGEARGFAGSLRGGAVCDGGEWTLGGTFDVPRDVLLPRTGLIISLKSPQPEAELGPAKPRLLAPATPRSLS